jgi:hypothetical protein
MSSFHIHCVMRSRSGAGYLFYLHPVNTCLNSSPNCIKLFVFSYILRVTDNFGLCKEGIWIQIVLFLQRICHRHDSRASTICYCARLTASSYWDMITTGPIASMVSATASDENQIYVLTQELFFNFSVFHCSCNCIRRSCNCNCIVLIVCSVSFIAYVVLCALFCLSVVFYFVWCVLFVSYCSITATG